ncbi:nitrogen fixation protein NifX [Acaryochloris sp. IP29b_bin.137]|uniref:nitrogen fixation protein NifX n=1 Tax=Acaryochloris sp. IP29b_bin.137 TaxID=2969217 RepID=UPI00260D4E57|nr:nitrogen fixation protein NifX [Acaryochloris sp. IP29b_bin.137]
MKIGFTTRDSVHINAHFGSASQIDVYDANDRGYAFLETLKFEDDLKEDGNEDKLQPKLQALKDCAIVYVSAIGGSAAARLIQKNITPIKAQSENDEIQDVLLRLVKTLNGSPPPWLRKALSKGQSHTFEDEFETTIEEEITV